MVQDMLGQNANIVAIAKAANLSRQIIYRIKDDPPRLRLRWPHGRMNSA